MDFGNLQPLARTKCRLCARTSQSWQRRRSHLETCLLARTNVVTAPLDPSRLSPVVGNELHPRGRIDGAFPSVTRLSLSPDQASVPKPPGSRSRERQPRRARPLAVDLGALRRCLGLPEKPVALRKRRKQSSARPPLCNSGALSQSRQVEVSFLGRAESVCRWHCSRVPFEQQQQHVRFTTLDRIAPR